MRRASRDHQPFTDRAGERRWWREQVRVQVIRETSKDGQVMRAQECRQMRTKGEGRQVSGAVRRQARAQERAGK